MKQPPSMLIFPHQQAENPPQNQHVLSFNPKLPLQQHVVSYSPPLTPDSHAEEGDGAPGRGSTCVRSAQTSFSTQHWHTHTSHAAHGTRSIPGPHIRKTDIHYRMPVCGGARGIRTPDLLIANETRYQLRHSPKDGYTLAPSEAFTQADHDQRGFTPKTARQNDR